MLSEARADLDLRVRCTSSMQALRLEYVAKNISSGTVFLFDKLHGDISAKGVYPLLAGAYVELESAAAVVSRKLFPVPDLMFVEHRNIPFVTRLLPGTRTHEVIELQLPLRPFDPYGSMDDEELIQWSERPLVFELGYFVGAEGTEELARSYQTDHGIRRGFDVFTASSQKLLRSAPLDKVPIVSTLDEHVS